MAVKLKDLARELILGKCKVEKDLPLEFGKTNPKFILIKDNKVSLSKDIESLDDADECMLFYTYFKDNTVPDRYKKDRFVTFRNPYNSFVYIDSKGESHYWYLDDGFEIVGIDYTCRLKYNDNELMSVDVTEEGIQNLWNCYQIAKKCLRSQCAELESKKAELEKKIELLATDYNKLSQRYEKVLDSIKGIIEFSELDDTH